MPDRTGPGSAGNPRAGPRLYYLTLTKLHIGMLVAGLAALLTAAFSLGFVLAGREPAERAASGGGRTTIVRLEPETPAPKPGEATPPADPQFYKVLTSPTKPAQEGALDPIRLPDARGRDVGRALPLEPRKEAPAQAAPQPSPAAPPGPPGEESQEAAPYPRGEGPPRYTIQVLSVQEADRAEHVLRELLSKGIPAFIEQAHLGDKGVWHRVRVGRFWDRSSAERTLQELRRKAGRGGSIVPL